MIRTVFYFQNGNVAVCDEHGNQIPELQEPIYQPIINAAIARGEDPTVVEYHLPNKQKGKVFKCDDGSYNMAIQ